MCAVEFDLEDRLRVNSNGNAKGMHNDGNGNGTVACLFCLVEQVVNQIIIAVLYSTDPVGMDFGSRIR